MAIDRRVDELNRSLDNNLDFGESGEAFEPAPPTIPGAPNGWTPPGPPENYRGYLPKLDAGAPLLFSEVDNPGGWSEFVFQPKYATERGRKKYVGHVTPAGAKVLPANDDGIREHDGWRFYYQGWKPDHFDAANFARGTATKDCSEGKPRRRPSPTARTDTRENEKRPLILPSASTSHLQTQTFWC